MKDLFIETKTKLIGTFSDNNFSYPQHGYMYIPNGIVKGVYGKYRDMLEGVCNGKTKIYK